MSAEEYRTDLVPSSCCLGAARGVVISAEYTYLIGTQSGFAERFIAKFIPLLFVSTEFLIPDVSGDDLWDAAQGKYFRAPGRGSLTTNSVRGSSL